MAITQRNATRNQSTADYSHKCIFLFDNRFREEVLVLSTPVSNEEVDNQAVEGKLVVRNGTDISLATDANLANVIGILKMDESVEIPDTGSVNVNIGTKGTIDETGLVLPDGVTLSTAVGSITLRDKLESIGFHLEETIEHTDFEQ